MIKEKRVELNAEEMASAQDCLWFGLFLDDDIEGQLENQTTNQHVTFGYKIAPPDDLYWNKTYPITVIGYGNDGSNEGYLCEIPDELEYAYCGSDQKHITLSTSEDGRPVDTGELEFEPIEPFVVYAKFGYYSRGRFVV